MLKNIPKNFWYFIGALTLLRLILIYFLPVTPQEAYYWYYSQNPALSYFDHPPMTAWSICFGSTLFGSNTFGVKFMAVFWGFLTNVILYITVQRAQLLLENRDETLAWKAVILYNLTVFSHMYSVLMVPDNPLIFFWLLTIFFILEVFISEKKRYWIYGGIALGFSLLSKYTGIALLPGFFAFLLISKKQRYWLKTPYPYLAVITAAVVFFPVVLWNMQNNWGSFAFQFSHRAADVRPFTIDYLLQLTGSQLGLLTPLIFGVFFYLTYKMAPIRNTNSTVRYFYLTGFFLIGGFIFISLKSLVKINWLLPGYTGWLIAAVLLFPEKIDFKRKIIRYSGAFSLFLILTIYLLQFIPNIPIGEGNTWSGWENASHKIYQIQQEHGGRKNCFIFANSYKSASLLKFYLPDQQDTYAQNIYEQPALQFDVWGTPDSLKGKNALYVFTDRREYDDDLKFVKSYFKDVTLIKTFHYKFGDKIAVRTIYCYLAKDYAGIQK